jgi:hypothetical protein
MDVNEARAADPPAMPMASFSTSATESEGARKNDFGQIKKQITAGVLPEALMTVVPV